MAVAAGSCIRYAEMLVRQVSFIKIQFIMLGIIVFACNVSGVYY